MHEMTDESKEIYAALQEMSAITQQSTAGIEETTATVLQSSKLMNEVAKGTEQLANLATALDALVKQYKLKRPPAKAGGFGHKCRRLKSLFKAQVLLKALMLKHTPI